MDANLQYTPEQLEWFKRNKMPVPGGAAAAPPKPPAVQKQQTIADQLRSGRAQTRAEELQK